MSTRPLHVPSLLSWTVAGRTQVFRPLWVALLFSTNCWLCVVGDRSVSPAPGDSAGLFKARSFEPGAKPQISQQDEEDFDDDGDLESEFGKHDTHQDAQSDAGDVFGNAYTPEQESHMDETQVPTGSQMLDSSPAPAMAEDDSLAPNHFTENAEDSSPAPAMPLED